MSEGSLGAWLFHIVSEDRNEAVRQRALEILEETSIRPTESSKREEIRSALLQDPSENIKKAFLKYLKAVGDVEDVPAIISAASDKDSGVREQAVRARIIVAARINQNDAFSVLLGSTEGISKDLLDEFSHLCSDVKDELLVEALQSNVDRVRAFALNELQRRNQLTKEIALKMREDASPEVRAICYRVLIEEGSLIEPSDVRKAFDGVSSRHSLLGLGFADTVDPDELVLDICRKLSLDQLIQRSDWYEIDGYLAYKAIALAHFSTEGDRIRFDLKDSFRSYKEKIDNSYRAKYGSIGDSIVTSYEEKGLNSFVKSRFTEAALAGLAENGGSEDVLIAREYLADSNDNVILEAVRIVERFGDPSDVGALLNLAKGKYGKLKESSAIAALRLSPGPEGAARALLDTGSSTLLGIVAKFLRDSPTEETAKLLEPLLSHKDDNVRLKALAFLGGKLSVEQLEELLKRYVSSGSLYYYNVVCWLDRILYGPSSLRDIFSQQLQAKLD